MRLFIFFILASVAAAQSVGDFSVDYRATSTGPQPIKSWAKANSTLWGTDGSGNPQSITIGTGLSLASGVISSTTSGGTVTSVALSLPGIFIVSGSPITASGTLTASLASQSANRVFAGPTTGSAAAPTFRALVAADLPDLSGVYQPLITDGSLTISRTNGLQAALDAKLSSSTAAADYLTIAAAAAAYQPKTNNLDELSLYGSSLGGQWAGDATKVAKYGNSGELGVSGSILIYGDLAGNVTTLTAQAGVNPTVLLPSTSGTLALTSGNISGTAAGLSSTLPVNKGGTGITSFGAGIAAALGVNIGSAGAPVLFNGNAGTPSAIVLTNATGTAAGLSVGNATSSTSSSYSGGLATTGATVVVSGASPPSAGQRLTATSSTAADWEWDKDPLVVACSDETTDLTTGTAKVTFRMPYAMTLTAVRLSVNTAPTGSVIIVDVKEGGTTIFSTKPQIATSAKTSVGGAVPGVISDTALEDDAEITINLDQIGSTIAGKGLKVSLIGTHP